MLDVLISYRILTHVPSGRRGIVVACVCPSVRLYMFVRKLYFVTR